MNHDTRQLTRKPRNAGWRLSAGVAVLLASAGFAWAIVPAMVPVGDAGNAGDATGYGAVDHAYRIGVDEITRAEYAAFLNSVAVTDTHGLYNPNMGITRSGSPGSYVYAAVDGARSVAWVGWYDALRFANWLHNGQPVGPQGPATTEDGAYTFSGDASVGGRNAGARVFLPSENEWYKAAYYQGGTDAWYWAYPIRSDDPPFASLPVNDENAANFDRVVNGPTPAGAYPASRGYYGTRDQAGNLWEWNEAVIGGDRGLRGGSYDDYQLLLQNWYRDSQAPSLENEFVGFRVAAAAGEMPLPANRAPVARAEGYTVNQGATLTVAAPGVLGNDTDVDGNALTAVLVSGAAHGSLALSANGSFIYTPAANYSGADSFSYKPNDGTVDGNTVTVAITVSAAPRIVIIDNSDGPARVTLQGAWSTSTYTSGYWNVNYLQDQNASKGLKSVTFRPNLPVSGIYAVSVWYPAQPVNAANVPVDIVSAEGIRTVVVNQQVNGGRWHPLGTNIFAAGTNGYVTIRTGGTTSYVLADAVKFTWIADATPPPPAVIVDNNDGPDRITLQGAWSASIYTNGYWSNNYLHDQNTSKGAKSVTFRPNLPTGGVYTVSVWYPSQPVNAANVPVDIVSAEGTSTVMVNQQVNGRQWYPIGTRTFVAGTNGYVTIRTGGTTSYVLADAVKFTWVGPGG